MGWLQLLPRVSGCHAALWQVPCGLGENLHAFTFPILAPLLKNYRRLWGGVRTRGRGKGRAVGNRIEITACSYKLLPLQHLKVSQGQWQDERGRGRGRGCWLWWEGGARPRQPKIDTSMKFISLHVQRCKCVRECVSLCASLCVRLRVGVCASVCVCVNCNYQLPDLGQIPVANLTPTKRM